MKTLLLQCPRDVLALIYPLNTNAFCYFLLMLLLLDICWKICMFYWPAMMLKQGKLVPEQ